VSGKSKKKKKVESADEAPPSPEGWESLAEEATEATLAPNPELEEAMRAAAAAIPDADEASSAGAIPDADEASSAGGEADSGAGDEAKDTGKAAKDAGKATKDTGKAAKGARDEAKDDDPQTLLAELQEAGERLLKDLLSVVDNLDRAIDHAQQSEGGDLQSLLQGVELVQRELLVVLGKHHVFEIDAMGKPFNPALHEAMAQVEDQKTAPNSIVDVLQKGYQLHDRLIRPSRVVVARGPEGEAGSGDDEGEEAAD
jgi:molecular chaperone GrpE